MKPLTFVNQHVIGESMEPSKPVIPSRVIMVFSAPDGSRHDIEGDGATLAFINTKLSERDALIRALRDAVKLVNGDNTRQASDVLREQWERLLGGLVG